MLTEEHEVFDSDDVVLVLFVMHIKIQKYLKLHTCLILKLLLISYNFKCTYLTIRVIEDLQGLPKTTGTQWFQHLIFIANVILKHSLIVAILVIVAIIVDVHLLEPFNLPLTWYHCLP